VNDDSAYLCFLGQAGYIMQACGVTAIIDPYLSDSAGEHSPFKRAAPPPIFPHELKGDVYIATHAHTDHLDPATLAGYRHVETTRFVAPRHCAKRFESLGIPRERITVIDQGDTANVCGIDITGVYALATDPGVLDTCGYLLKFPNGKSVYHTSDTAWCELLAQAAPKNADVMLVCINGKFGNLNVAQAVALTQAAEPGYVIPNHYDVMPLNAENPETFRYFCEQAGVLPERIVILDKMDVFEW
jgi:L-ascorbate 6-phosphate lactonase